MFSNKVEHFNVQLIEKALINILANSVNELEASFVYNDQIWIVKQNADWKCLHEGIGVLEYNNQSVHELFLQLNKEKNKAQVQSLISIPTYCSSIFQQIDKVPFKKLDESFNGQILVCDSTQDFFPSYKLGKESELPVYIKHIGLDSHKKTLLDKIGDEFFSYGSNTEFFNMKDGIIKSQHNDFIGFYLKDDDQLIGGTIVCNYKEYCQPLYDFIYPAFRGRGYFMPIIALFQKYALKPSNKYIIGEIFSDDKSASLIRIFKSIGATVAYERTYWAEY